MSADMQHPGNPWLHDLKLASAVILVLIVVLAVLYLIELPLIGQSPQSALNQVISGTLQTIQTAARSGDYSVALQQAQGIASSSAATDDQKALAELSTAGIPYRTTASPQFITADIPVIKSIIQDPNVSAAVRAAAINQLSSSYCGSGRTPEVFNAIYQGTPYSSFLVQGDPDTSSRNMFEWSYGMYPTADAAIFLARSYAGFAMFATSTASRTADLNQASYYLQSAQTLEAQESSNETFDYNRSQRYAVYLYWQAYTTGILEHYSKSHRYDSAYKTDYENFISTYAGTGGLEYNYVPYAHLLYGYFLILNDKDQTDAIAQFNAIPVEVKTDPYYNTDQFVRFIANDRAERTSTTVGNGAFSFANSEAQSLSPQFAAFAASIK